MYWSTGCKKETKSMSRIELGQGLDFVFPIIEIIDYTMEKGSMRLDCEQSLRYEAKSKAVIVRGNRVTYL